MEILAALWPETRDALRHVAYWTAALPLLLWLIRAWKSKATNDDAGCVALAFFVSFLIDSVMMQLGFYKLNNWWVQYIGYPIQFGILIGCLVRFHTKRVLALGFLTLVAIAAALRGTLDKPETMTCVLGGAAACFLVWGVEPMKRYRWPIWLYGGLTIPAILTMGKLDVTDPAWLNVEAVYHVLRLLAYGWLTVAVVREGVVHGPRLVRQESDPVSADRRWISDRRFHVGGGAHRLPQAAKR